MARTARRSGLGLALLVVGALLFAVACVSFISAKHAGDVLTKACLAAKISLTEGDAQAAVVALDDAGITDETAWRLTTTCAETRTSAADAAKSPSAAEAARTGEVVLACSLASAELERGDPARALAILDGAKLSEDERAFACGATAKTAANLTASGLSAASLPGIIAVPSASSATAAQPGDEAGTPLETPPARVGTWWDEFTKSYISPVATVLTWSLASALALFVLARLLVPLPGWRNLRSSRRDRFVFGWLGWILLLFVPVFLTAVGVMVAAGVLSGASVALLLGSLGGLGLLASISVAAWLATLLRIFISVTAPQDSTLDRAQVMERVRILAGRRGGTIELPASADVTALGNSLTAISENPLLAGVQKVLLLLVGVVPWNAAIEVRGNRRASVIIARNGHTLSARQVIAEGAGLRALDDLPKPLTDADVLATFVAAEILMSVRPWYALDFEKGLYGATVAVSVALQHIAVAWYMRQPHSPEADDLLTTANGVDPFNRLAQASLMNARYRQSSDISTLVRYRKWVDTELSLSRSSKREGQPADELERGLLVTRAAIARNLAALLLARSPADTPEPEPSIAAPLKIEEATGWPPGRRGAWTFARTAADMARADHLRAQEAAESAEYADIHQIDARTRDARAAADRTHMHAERARLAAEQAYSRWAPRAAWQLARDAGASRRDAMHGAGDATAAKDAVLKAKAAAKLAADRRIHCNDALLGLKSLLAQLRIEEESLSAENVRATGKGDARVKDRAAQVRLVIQQKALVEMLLNLRPPVTEMGSLLKRQKELQSELSDDLDTGEDATAVRRAPALAYGFACYLTRWKGEKFDNDLVLELLETSIAIDTFAEFAKDDPELSTTGDPAGFDRFVARAATVLQDRKAKATDAPAAVATTKLV
ncbi:hypothetical protein [Cryobacterium zhongshanensis]|uniref:Uncharacterized protein n=1 Tax=Cryobacterium zhongshanensis TaxID=2928153 RepID=A0AA41QXZ8_9MICO|nr:hypothetical protein [Cryobacterium zhongshanensis]MCI4658924.1 hypothetical protein [Cryobacterium zhongshanensis]